MFGRLGRLDYFVEQISLRILRCAVLFQCLQLFFGDLDDGLWYAGQSGDLQAVTLAGCAFVDAVQKHDVVLMFDSSEMHIGELRKFVSQTRQFKIVRGKQRVAAVGFQEVPRPISSTSTRLFCVALCRILAASVISTMNVERPLAKSSAAPMRVKIWSISPMMACCAGTKQPTWASSTI